MTQNSAVIELLTATDTSSTPPEKAFTEWASCALLNNEKPEITIRVVDEAESESLNTDYRGIAKPTNVLSFPFEAPEGIPDNHLGDLVICAAVVEREAAEQGKPPLAHWAHITVHGVLHLQGFDHQNSGEAEEMEALERRILASLGFPDPYN